YRNTFGCVRETVPIVPRAIAAPDTHTAPGPQTALVVGLPETVNTTARDHQVRVQFAWQRGAAANPGGLHHNTDSKGNAPGNQASGAWVRVAEALAGPNWGSQFTPRLGTEVLVDFIEGDIDRPLVVAQLYTGADIPPYSAGIDSGSNHGGVLSGMHSNNFDGDGYNQWVIDDTPGQLRTRLASSSAATQLNLGYLVQQAAGSAQRGAYRGSGFELRTDAWGMLRGAEGLLISSSARQQQGSGIASTQLDTAEAAAQLRGAAELSKVLAQAAQQQQALLSKDANAAQPDLLAHIDPQQKGRMAGNIGGHSALKAKDGARQLDEARPVEQFGAPWVLLEAPASINWATPASTALFAGGQLHWTTQSDTHWSAAQTLSSVSAQATGLFTHAGGIQAIAGNGPLSLQAHTDQLEILADQAITVISVNDVIEIKANQKITLQAGQSSMTLEGGNITFAC
ncbi:type VI secretion system Vgr family protein, partial [Janthinobacterium agaricidamnosum]|uniref:type VI secretion system Vgr family protein n=1 Tax=Janthinobacterium agaricidamnosum TaxID=55508 RepID=UPI000AF22992